MAVKYAETHLASPDHYKTKDSILREPLGARSASAITPQEIDEWLTKHCRTNTTANRYPAFISLAYRLGMKNGKVPSNPAQLVRLRTPFDDWLQKTILHQTVTVNATPLPGLKDVLSVLLKLAENFQEAASFSFGVAIVFCASARLLQRATTSLLRRVDTSLLRCNSASIFCCTGAPSPEI
jgi:hypothetical protein